MLNFISADWRRLALLNYAVPPELLEPLLAPGLTLDLWQKQAYVSLVAFEFVETKVLGVKWPGFTAFPEINLRFYVRHGDRRGVQFVKELVPSRWVAFLARALYNEPYQAYPMSVEVQPLPSHGAINIRHKVKDLLDLRVKGTGAWSLLM